VSDVEEKRKAIAEAYPGSLTWEDKVAKMQDSQVIAVYLRLKAQGKVN